MIKQVFSSSQNTTGRHIYRRRKESLQGLYLLPSYPFSSPTGNNIADAKTFTTPSANTNHIVSGSILSEIPSKRLPTIKPTPKFLCASSKNLNLFPIKTNSIREVRP